MLQTKTVQPVTRLLPSIAIASWACLAVLLPGAIPKAVALAVLPMAALGWWLFRGRDRWVLAFFFCAILLPPLPIALGDSGPHLAPLLALAGMILAVAGPLRLDIPHLRLVSLATAFVACLVLSECFAAAYSGPEVALLGLFRIGLFCISPLVLVCTLAAPNSQRSLRVARLLFRMAVAAGVFACADFYFQFPSPAGFGAQFVWLDTEVLRRAQGLFYEASTLGNFCAFFLVFALVFVFAPKCLRPCTRVELVFGSCVLFTALVLSYSRASLLNLLCSGGVFLVLSRQRRKRIFITGVIAAVVSSVVIAAFFPTYLDHYWIRLQQSVIYSTSSPDAVLSGRLTSWETLSHFASEHSLQLIFGVGYKTLPYSDYLGASVIADNTYLSLLIETGIIGLLAFLSWNFEMLRQSLHALRRPICVQSLLATVFFCFWIGEMVQMLSGDLITYWRVLPIYLWALGAGLQSSGSAPIGGPSDAFGNRADWRFGFRSR